MTPGEPLGHEAHGELARGRPGQIHQRQPCGLGDERVARALRHKAERHECLGKLDVLAIRVSLRSR